MNLGEVLVYKTLRIRMVEEKIIQLYPSDKIQSPVHLSIGQEAVAVGICQNLRPTDLLFATYRSHAFYLAKGGSLRQMFAELYGKATGCCGGKGGSMHLAAPEVGFMGTSAIVASSIPQAVGAAHAAKLLNKDQIVTVVFGDGAMDEGVYHESLNYASLHGLPLVFVCENNGLAVHSDIDNRQSFEPCQHAESYFIHTYRCFDGYDAIAVYHAFERAITEAAYISTPQLLVVDTYRCMEHVGTNDDHNQPYRNPALLKEWQAKDATFLTHDLVARYRPLIQAEIDDAVAFAEASSYPTEMLCD